MLKLKITDNNKPILSMKGNKIDDFDDIMAELKVKYNGKKR